MNADSRNTTLDRLARISMSTSERARAEEALRMSETIVSLLMSVVERLGFGSRQAKPSTELAARG